MKLHNHKKELIVKYILISIMIIVVALQFSGKELDSYYSYEDYIVNENTENLQFIEYSIDGLSQKFIAQGNILNSVNIYLNDVSESKDMFKIAIKDNNNLEIFSQVISMDDCDLGSWNRIDLGMLYLKINEVYSIDISGNADILTNISLENKNQTVFFECLQNNQELPYILDIGLQFTYRYLSLGSLIMILLDGFFVMCMIFILSYAIFNFKKLYHEFLISEKKQGFTYALVGALFIIFHYNPLNQIRTEVGKFSRVFGVGFVKNYDVSKVIQNFRSWFITFVCVFILLFLLINYKKKEWNNIKDKRYVFFLDNLIILALTMQLLRCVTFFYDKSITDNMFYYSSFLLELWIGVVGLVLSTKLNKVIDYEALVQTLVISFSTGFPIAIFISDSWQSGKILIGVQTILSFVNLIIYYVTKLKKFSHINKIYDVASLMLALFPFLTSVYIESIHILNQYGIFIIHLKKLYLLICCLYIMAIIVVSLALKSKFLSFQKWKTWIFMGMILGVTSLSVQVPLQITPTADIFESANYSILISDFLNFGSIPIVEHYGGHMMQGVWEGIIYALLNNDCQGAILSPYSDYIRPILAILFFLLLKNIWNEDIAVWAVLVIPFYNNWRYYGLGFLVCFATSTYVRKKTWFRAFGIWLAVAWCTIYKLDLGFAFALAVIIALMIYVIKITQCDLVIIKQLVMSFAITIAGGIGIWIILCLIKNVDPFGRLREFIEISASNQNWAYYGIGDSSKAAFAWCYIIVPLFVALGIIYIIFSKEVLKRVCIEKWMILLVLGFSYFFNFSRGLTRHSLAENFIMITLWCALLFVAIVLAAYLNKNYLCIPFFIILVVFNTAFIKNENYNESNIADTATSKLDDFIDTWTIHQMRYGNEENNNKTYWEELSDKKKKVNRVINTLDSEVLSYQKIMDILLQDNETYIDFISRSFVYSAIGRKCPVYIAQSPGMLSGEYSQERFVAEIEENIDNIPLAILPIINSYFSVGLDGISNAYRYYKVSEFIYSNYRPLCSNGEFAVWCLKDRYEDMLNKLDFTAQEANLDYVTKLPHYDCELSQQRNGVQISAANGDPRIENLHEAIDLQDMDGLYVKISVDYQIDQTDQTGIMQLFYTTNEGETYSEKKSCHVNVANEGSAEFQIYITKNTKLRLDIPNECTIRINKITCAINKIDWGYDGATVSIDEYGNTNYSYYSQLHNYELDQLPRIWAEKDIKNAAGNKTLYTTDLIGDTYVFSGKEFDEYSDACYLLLSSEYSGQDIGGNYEPDDEFMKGVVCLGWYDGDSFKEKCRYSLTLQEGEHNYLIRISTDYFWHLGEINAAQLSADYDTSKTSIKILEGD